MKKSLTTLAAVLFLRMGSAADAADAAIEALDERLNPL